MRLEAAGSSRCLGWRTACMPGCIRLARARGVRWCVLPLHANMSWYLHPSSRRLSPRASSPRQPTFNNNSKNPKAQPLTPLTPLSPRAPFLLIPSHSDLTHVRSAGLRYQRGRSEYACARTLAETDAVINASIASHRTIEPGQGRIERESRRVEVEWAQVRATRWDQIIQ